MKQSNTKKKHIDILFMYVGSGIAVFLGIGILLYSQVFTPSHPAEDTATETFSAVTEEESKSKEEVSCPHIHPLTGVCVEDDISTSTKLIAVMIENHFESWPHAGIADAQVVYEAPVEGNIPRFLAFFNADQTVEKVGPIRSSRPFFLDWVAEYGTPMYAHVGGTYTALETIKARVAQGNFNNLDEMMRGWYFWRSSDRYMPHNTYSSSDLWQDALDTYADAYTEKTFDSWVFDASLESCSVDCITSVTIDYGSPTYTQEWKYLAEHERYARYQAGAPHRDELHQQVFADTIIVQQVQSLVDGGKWADARVVSSGDAWVFQKGIMIEGTWKKENVTDRTRWYDRNGEEIALNPGTIWIEVLNRDGLSYK